MWGIIGGSGFEKFEGFKTIEDLPRETPFGLTSKGIKYISIGGVKAIFIPRHGSDHGLTPSEVNYRANIFAIKKYGGTKILSISAVGSLREELAPGDLVVTSQYIDRTKSLRKSTFCGEGIVGHVSQALPTSESLSRKVKELKDKCDFKIHFDKTYVCIEGPTFSTRAESQMYRSFGADIVGMTNVPECHLAKEAGLAYLPFSFVTDYDCWKNDRSPVTVQEVIAIMKNNNQKAFHLAEMIIPMTDSFLPQEREEGLKNGLMNSIDHLSLEKKEWLNIILS